MVTVRMGDPGNCLEIEISKRGTLDEAKARVSLQLDDLSASRTVAGHYGTGFADLVDYFDGLERRWRGWPGARRWEALEHDLVLEARHDGHVHLEVQLGIVHWSDWAVSAQLTLEPGEQLSRAAADLRSAFTAA